MQQEQVLTKGVALNENTELLNIKGNNYQGHETRHKLGENLLVAIQQIKDSYSEYTKSSNN
jgi:hypothetical protein